MIENGNFNRYSLGNLGEVRSTLNDQPDVLNGEIVFTKDNSIIRSAEFSKGHIVRTEGFPDVNTDTDKSTKDKLRGEGLIVLLETAKRMNETEVAKAEAVLRGINQAGVVLAQEIDEGKAVHPGVLTHF